MSEADEIERLRDDPIAKTVSALSANGFPRMPAAVLMTLMTSEEAALSADQLCAELQASPAAVSGAVKYLGTVGMIARHQLGGSRRYVYELPQHAWYTASLGKNELYTLIASLAEQAAPTLGPRGRARLEEMSDFFRFLEWRMPALLVEWETGRRAQQDEAGAGTGAGAGADSAER
ncbi:GbsR/MarR family transcriptional regulator [Plantibacter sp. Mn2098]|uniref:GbsR/MarR family transcriptional regulator n=1 Tax=Plantibacter sp. Mn2098 TaxID=3395266 RepID=UPI003BE26B14